MKDVEAAYALYREALKQSAVDPTTGRVDVNILAAGMSATSRKQVSSFQICKFKFRFVSLLA